MRMRGRANLGALNNQAYFSPDMKNSLMKTTRTNWPEKKFVRFHGTKYPLLEKLTKERDAQKKKKMQRIAPGFRSPKILRPKTQLKPMKRSRSVVKPNKLDSGKIRQSVQRGRPKRARS